MMLRHRLLAEYNKPAVQTHRTLSSVIQDALAEALLRRREAARGRRVELITADRGFARFAELRWRHPPAAGA